MRYRRLFGKVPGLTIAFIVLIAAQVSYAQSTVFTYQGKLSDSGSAANGNYDFQFKLWDAIVGGTQQPQPTPITLTRNSVAVASGSFTVQLDFTVNAFPGVDRFLEISVRPTGVGAFVTLSPRQQISSTPYAIRTISATTADALSTACVACVQDAQIDSLSGSKLLGMIPTSSMPANSQNYIQNRTGLQTNSNFNISGNGIIGGSVGIGTSSPISKFHIISGTADLLPPRLQSSATNTFAAGLDFYHASTAQGYVGVPDAGATTGPGEMLLFGVGKTSLWAGSARSVTLDTNGNMGIGLLVPTFKLDVLGNVRARGNSSNDVTVETLGGTNAWARLNMKSQNQEWTLGTSLNFNFDQFYLYDFTYGLTRMTIGHNNGPISFPSGNVGIGTTNPTLAKLQVNDGNVGTAIYGTSSLGSGVFGESTNAAGWGVYGNAPAGGYAMYANGNSGQARDKAGWVKAMLYVDSNTSIVRCYNSFLTGSAASTVPCGFMVTRYTAGGYTVELGFRVDDRFVSVTAEEGHFFGNNDNTGAYFTFRPDISPNAIDVHTFQGDQSGQTADAGFMLIIY